MTLILVIDDAALSRRILCKALQKEGFTTLEATNGVEGLNMIQVHNPDCIILDMLMPDLPGREVLKQLQEEGIKTPVIVVTADIQKTTRQQCLELGAITVLNKLVDQNQLCQWVREAISPRKETQR